MRDSIFVSLYDDEVEQLMNLVLKQALNETGYGPNLVSTMELYFKLRDSYNWEMEHRKSFEDDNVSE